MAYPGVDEDAGFPEKGYAMRDDTVVALRHPRSFSADPLTDILRAGARQLLAQEIEAEVEVHNAAHADLTDAPADGSNSQLGTGLRYPSSAKREGISTGKF